MTCSQCGSPIHAEYEDCRNCDGTGDDGTEAHLSGCVSCGGRGTIAVYSCDCREEDE